MGQEALAPILGLVAEDPPRDFEIQRRSVMVGHTVNDGEIGFFDVDAAGEQLSAVSR